MENNEQTKKLSWLGMEAPRYTSYPTAHHFSAKVDEAVYGGWLGEISDDTSVSLYIHIPFCRELCWFCGCHTKITNHYAPIARYVQYLLKEIELVKQQKGLRGKFTNIHFGGGSPSILSGEDMQAIMQAAYSLFAEKPAGEVAIELDPRTTTPENIKLYADLGFNRVSLGIQDFDAEVQTAINRIQPYEMVEAVMQNLRDAGIAEINCDLIYGLPKQNMESFKRTLQQTITLNPQRIALFSYAHVPSVKKHMNLIDTSLLPSDLEKLELYATARATLENADYQTIGIDHFAKASDPLAIAAKNRTMKRNFQGYVTDDSEVLVGLGVSAISQFPQGYAQATTNSLDYRTAIDNKKLPIVRGYAVSAEDVMRKRIIDEIMCFMNVDLAKFEAEYKLPENYFNSEINELQKLEYSEIATCNNKQVAVITEHLMAARVVASVFDKHKITTTGRYSKVA